MEEDSLKYEVGTDLEEDEGEYLRPEIIYENNDITYEPESDEAKGTMQLGSLVEYVYDENLEQSNNHQYSEEHFIKTEESLVCYQDGATIENGGDVIEPMMPFFLSSSPIFTILNEDDEVGETIILQIENEEDTRKSQRKPIPDEIRASTLQILLCTSKTNTTLDTYTCNICSVSYGCLNCLKSHYETMHLGNTIISRYKCEFSTNISKGLYCPVCELTFDTRNDTMDHYITHAVACDICGSGFDRQLYLAEHLRTVHNQGGFDVYYECELCKTTYQYGSSLSKHYQNVHKLVLCVVCKSKFEDVNDLREHEKTHRPKIDVLPFACSKCDKAFDKISDIAVHLRRDHNHKRKIGQIETVYVINNVGNKGMKKKVKTRNID